MTTNSNVPIQGFPSSIFNLFSPFRTYQMPLYQRQYCWTSKKELKDYAADLDLIFEDLTKPNSSATTKKFLGAVVLRQEESSGMVDYRTVIDGQQRVTTIFLTIAALSNYAFRHGWKDKAFQLAASYLGTLTMPNTPLFPRIQPTNLDVEQFNTITQEILAQDFQVLDGGGPKRGGLLNAWKFIQEQVVQTQMDKIDPDDEDVFDQLCNHFLHNFVIADVTLDTTYDSNEVFDSLNQKGQKLGRIDLIRNNVFHAVSKEKGANHSRLQHFFDSDWKPFEDHLKTPFDDHKGEIAIRRQADDFFFPFALNVDDQISKADLVSRLKEYWEASATTPKSMLADMRTYLPDYFVWLQGEDFSRRIPSDLDETVRRKIVDLHQMKFPQVATAFLMRCYHELQDNRIPAADFIEILSIVESFYVRRAITFQEEGTGYHAIFKRLWRDSHGGDPAMVRDKIWTKTKLFPTDDQFRRGILETDLYSKTINKYCLLKYEEELSEPLKEHYPQTIIESADHISPQNFKGLQLTTQMRSEYERTNGLWGNLLPMNIPLNSSKKDKNPLNSLQMKDIVKLFKRDSRTETTREWIEKYENQETWTPELIDSRTRDIADWAIQRWPSYEHYLD